MSGSLRLNLFSPDGLDQTVWDVAAFSSRVGQEMSDARSKAIKNNFNKVKILAQLLLKIHKGLGEDVHLDGGDK